MPGVPDFYQGAELWDFSLVDPDNRHPVDFAARQAAVGGEPDWDALAKSWTDGRIKLALTHRLLALRDNLPAVFRDGDYRPVEVPGRSATISWRSAAPPDTTASWSWWRGTSRHDGERHALAGHALAGHAQDRGAAAAGLPGRARRWRRDLRKSSGGEHFRCAPACRAAGRKQVSTGTNARRRPCPFRRSA